MPTSHIKLVEVASGRQVPAAPERSVLASSADLNWKGITVELHHLAPTQMPEHIVCGHRLLVHAERPVPFEWKDGNRWRQKLLMPGDFNLQSHRTLNEPRWTKDFRFVAIALDPAFVGRVFQDWRAPEHILFRELRGENDPVVTQFVSHFRAELQDRSYTGALYGESLGIAFALHLLERYGKDSKPLSLPRGKLAPAALRRTIELIHANLAEDLSIEELARAANLSAFHFARLFKQTLGSTPHQYVLQNRIERAKRLIIGSPRLNLTDIGLSVGFFDQAHFTKAFKRVVGTTPKSFLKHVA